MNYLEYCIKFEYISNYQNVEHLIDLFMNALYWTLKLSSNVELFIVLKCFTFCATVKLQFQSNCNGIKVKTKDVKETPKKPELFSRVDKALIKGHKIDSHKRTKPLQ